MPNRKRKKEIPEFCFTIGSHIRLLRKEKGKTIEEIAHNAGLDAQNLRKYELGKQEMRISMLKRIVDAFDLNLSTFFESLEKRTDNVQD